jgi:hypothetical protein
MRRREPPSLATWMLEHLTPAGRDEALGGDLLEEFRGGRSEGWYWWQVLSACSVGLLNSLRARGLLLVFALCWSMLAPAWNVLCDGLRTARSSAACGRLPEVFGYSLRLRDGLCFTRRLYGGNANSHRGAWQHSKEA